jgi:glycosyltransferase involved in cell wall biosynthesis
MAGGGHPRVSILMPNLNNAPVLDEVFESVARHTSGEDFELIVADDGSTDGSIEILRRWRDSGRFRNFTLLEREHSGIVPTLNSALDAVGGDVIVRIDGDTTVETPGWLDRMLAFHATDGRIGVSVAKVIIDTGHVHMCGVDITVPEGMHDRGSSVVEPLGERTLAAETEHPLEADSPIVDEPAEVDSVLGCWTMFPADLAREIGGWDMGYNPVWYEDIDFALAARAQGRKVFYVPDVRVTHHLNRRKPRHHVSPVRRVLAATGRRFGRYAPASLRHALGRKAGVGAADPTKVELLSRHRDHWRRKWGWDPLNPDLEEIRRRWGDTEVWWRHDPDRREQGEQILAAWRKAADPVASR